MKILMKKKNMYLYYFSNDLFERYKETQKEKINYLE